MPKMPGPALTYATSKADIEKQIRARLKASGVVAPQLEPVLAEFVQDCLVAQRERLAGLVESLQNIYDSLDAEKMETLAHMIRNHRVDESGFVVPDDA